MASTNSLDLLKTGKYQEGIRSWKDLLEENVLHDKALVEIKKGKEEMVNLGGGEAQEKEFSDELELLSTLYHVSPCEPIRWEKGEMNSAPPGDLRVHPDGRLVITDETRHQVQFFSKEGVFLSAFGEEGNQAGQFQYPKKLCCAPDGTIFVADTWNHRIQQFHADGKFLREFGEYGDEMGQFNEPHGIVSSDNGWLYVLDRCNHRVQVMDRNFKLIGSFGMRGSVMEEELAYLCNTPPTKFSPPAFEFPTAIEADSEGNLYVADCNNHRIVKFNSYGCRSIEWGLKGSGKGEFMYPQALAVDAKDNLFVADMNNRRVQRFGKNGEFLYSIPIPGSESDSMAVPVALACWEEKLYVGLGFSPKILVFQYQPHLPSNFEHFQEKYKQEDFGKSELASLVSKSKAVSESLKKEGASDKQINLVAHLESFHDVLEKEIRQLKKEWRELSDSFIPALKKNIELVLQDKVSELEFDEALHQLESRQHTLIRDVKRKLTRFKCVFEESYKLRSLIISKSDKESLPTLKPFYADWLNRTQNLSSFLVDLLSEREKFFADTEGPYQVFVKEQKEKRIEFKHGYYLFSGWQIFVDQANFALGFALLAIRDWVFYLKRCDAPGSQLEDLSQEIFMGEIGADLESILSKLGCDWENHDFISHRIKLLAMALKFAGVGSSCMVQSSFTNLPETSSEEGKRGLAPLLIPFFLRETENGGLEVGPYNYSAHGLQKSETLVDFTCNAFAEFIKAGGNVAAPIKSFLENAISVFQHKSDTMSILNSAASIEEKVELLQKERLDLLDYQQKLNLHTVGNLFLGLKWDYRSLFPYLFYLKLNDSAKAEEIHLALNENIGKYRDFLSELQKLANEKSEEMQKIDTELSGGEEGPQTPAAGAELEKRKDIAHQTFSLLVQIKKRLSELIELHKLLNQLMEKAAPAGEPNGILKKINPEPDLVFGEPGFGFEKLLFPVGITMDSEGRLTVCDLENHSIKRFLLEGTQVDEAGGYGTMPTSFKYPNAIACDSEGNSYISEFAFKLNEANNRRVQKISTTGEHLFTIGGAGGGELRNPSDLFLDHQGRLWVSDVERSQILIYSNAGKFIKSVGKEGEGPGEFKGLMGLALMKNGDVLASEIGNRRIQILDSEGNHKSFCMLDALGIGNVYNLTAGPEATLLLTDYSNHCVYVFDGNYQPISCFGSFGIDRGKFNGPLGLVCHNDFLFVCEHDNHRIQRFKLQDIL